MRLNPGYLFIAMLMGPLIGSPVLGEDATEIAVFKTPTCGCCGKWVEHLRQNGFEVTVTEQNDLSPVKAKNGIPRELSSCHTGIVDGYVVEGHVPADVIRRLLAERPDIKGIVVPGMPAGSPGMEIPSGHVQPYEVLTFDAEGKTEVYATRGK